ncbi:hypothetical protein FQR65_LT00342 [Abscondita terminalis]|nr:hypothetical protein FQR65_LT00342 [Abscondita terminalis]
MEQRSVGTQIDMKNIERDAQLEMNKITQEGNAIDPGMESESILVLNTKRKLGDKELQEIENCIPDLNSLFG